MTEALGFLSTLVGFPTESRTPNIGLIDWVADRLGNAGARVRLDHGPAGRANLFASFGPDVPGGLLLSGHTDVVPAGSGWSTDPYLMSIDGDRVAGRGTADMKGFLAVVLAGLAGRHGSFSRPLHLALSYDEEVGCQGVRSLLAQLAAEPDVRPDLVLIGEPTQMRPRHSHLGKLAYDVTFHGEAGHSSRSHTLPSAITHAASFIATLDRIQAAHRPDGGHEPSVTINCGTIHGGTGLNVIADRCVLDFEVRHDVSHDPDRLIGDILTGLDAVEKVRYPALATDATHAMVRLAERLADAGLASPIGFGTEGGLFAAALGAPVVICGPGDIADAHRADEYVTIAQLDSCRRFLAALIRECCEVPSSP